MAHFGEEFTNKTRQTNSSLKRRFVREFGVLGFWMIRMARYEHLKIYKASFDLVKLVETQVRVFSKYNKYTLGSDLRDFSRKILFLVIEINNLYQKQAKLKELELEIEKLKILIRLCKELNAFSGFGAYENIITKTIEIAKITHGWLKSSKQ